MKSYQEQLATLEEIRSLMQRSSRFTSLSGLSGVAVGLLALAGTGLVNWHLNQQNLLYQDVYQGRINQETAIFLVTVVLSLFILAVGSVLLLTGLKAQKSGQAIWHHQGQRLFSNLFIPIAVGGLFCLILLYHNILYLVAPCMLIFYGLALIHSSKYTFSEIRYLGLGEIALGLLACFQIEYGLIAWGMGFGGLNILYGALIHYTYERNGSNL
ncbi:hypothetical protein ACFQ4C_20680 [Larkinella insperata]|uniref:Uncharacterized protein n=1 Tax=Larkinella insperata TaxID=332158 RepID=A0ABW3QNJ2_9BACT